MVGSGVTAERARFRDLLQGNECCPSKSRGLQGLSYSPEMRTRTGRRLVVTSMRRKTPPRNVASLNRHVPTIPRFGYMGHSTRSRATKISACTIKCIIQGGLTARSQASMTGDARNLSTRLSIGILLAATAERRASTETSSSRPTTRWIIVEVYRIPMSVVGIVSKPNAATAVSRQSSDMGIGNLTTRHHKEYDHLFVWRSTSMGLPPHRFAL